MTHTMSIATVSNTAVSDLLETCGNLRLINDEDLQSLGIHRHTLSDPALRFAEPKLIALWNWLADNSSRPDIGLVIGQTINPSAKGLLASWVSQAESIAEALDIFRTNISLMNPSEHWDIHENKGTCTLRFSLRQDKAYPSITVERSMSAMVAWGRILSGHPFPLIAAHFSFPRPGYAQKFTPIFGQHIEFESKENRLVFDSQFLTLPIISGNQYLKSLIEDKAKATLQDLTKNESLTRKTKLAIEKQMVNNSAISIDALCDELAISRQTLYRKLKEEGSDFKSLSDDYRKQEALKLLQQEAENITSVGLRLGYQDASSFYKAFKRWFGMSPGDYRRSLDA